MELSKKLRHLLVKTIKINEPEIEHVLVFESNTGISVILHRAEGESEDKFLALMVKLTEYDGRYNRNPECYRRQCVVDNTKHYSIRGSSLDAFIKYAVASEYERDRLVHEALNDHQLPETVSHMVVDLIYGDTHCAHVEKGLTFFSKHLVASGSKTEKPKLDDKQYCLLM